ncbi:MAG: sigma-70 family RNA polymerase sigma factor [Pirellulaceae bacterium]
MNKNIETATRAYQQLSATKNPDQLILDNIDYVRKILSTLTVGLPEYCDKESLEQAGMVGLIETAKSFDPTRGVQFRTYAFPRIRGAIIDEMRKNSMIPQKTMELIADVKKAYETLEGPVTPEMLAKKLSMPLERVLEVLEAMRFMQPQSWSDLQCHIHSSWKDNPDAPEAELEAAELKTLLANCIEKLPERERLVLTLYYTEDLTLAEIGEVIGITESRVSRILASAKFRLKEIFENASE